MKVIDTLVNASVEKMNFKKGVRIGDNTYKKIGNHSQNTYLRTDNKFDNVRIVRKFFYYDTCICEVVEGYDDERHYYRQFSVTYDDGGYKTSSTTRAINCYKAVFGE